MTPTTSASPQQAAASGICSSFHRAYRDLRLYPPGHPTARESVEHAAAAVTSYVETWGTLTLDVQENALLSQGDPVYLHETSRDNLAFLMFRDGVRTLALRPDCGLEEIEALMDCLAHADDLAEKEHDLVTALWERDLSHIDYHVVDPFLGGGTLPKGMVDALRETVRRRLEAVEAPGVSPADLAKIEVRQVRPRQIDRASLQLTPEEVERGERAIEDLASVVQDFAEVLLEIADDVPITAANDILIRSLTSVVTAFLDGDDLAGARFVLERLTALEAQLWLPDGSVGRVVGGAVTVVHVRGLLQGAGQVSGERTAEDLGFLGAHKRWIFAPLLEVLVETGDRAVRKTILDILGGEGSVPWRGLEPLLEDPRWYVVRNAVQLAAAAAHDQLADHAQRLLGHEDARVRRELVRALERLGGRVALNGLTRAMADRDLSVRVLAAGAIGRKGGRESEALLLARIEDRGFALLSGEEMEALFGAYADLVRERAVPLLDRSWRRRSFSSRPVAFRVAAVRALGRVHGPAARASLQAAAKSRESQVRRAATEAAQGRTSSASGERS